MNITELSIKRPILIIVFFLVISLLGLFTITQLKYELLPKINAPIITISCIYAGASPAEIENTLTKKIEEAVAGVSKIKRITSRSNEGFMVTSIEFLQDTDLDKSMQEVQRYINQIIPELPVGVKNPVVDKFSLSDLPILRIAATSQMSDNQFFDLLKDDIKPRLMQIKGVGRIQLIGGQERELKVFLNENKLKFYKISILSVLQTLQKANIEIPIGEIKSKDIQLGLRINGKFAQINALEMLDISVNADGSKIKLKDIAQIHFDNKEDYMIARLNQKNAIGIVLQKQSNANAVEVAHKVKTELEKIKNEYQNKNIQFEIAADSSEFTLKATETVFHDLLIAIVLVALVMLVFLHSLRNALIVMIAIPSSLVFAFIGMFLMDFTLNLMTLLAMSLVIGILVDDSIVVLENIYRHLEMGKDKEKASLEGRNEISFSALSITLVDVVVFLPLAFVPGITGGLVKEFALVIVVSTLASLLVCFTLTPMLASKFAKLEHLSPKTLFGKIILGVETFLHWLNNQYIFVLKNALKKRWLLYIIVFGTLFSSFLLVTEGYIGGEFVPSTDKGELSVTIELPSGTKISETNHLSKKLEKQFSQIPEIKRVFGTIGLANDPIFGELKGNNMIEFAILLVDKEKRNKSVTKISQEIKNMVLQEAGVKIKVVPIGLIGAEATPIQIVINGTERSLMMKYAQQLKNHVKTIEGTDDVLLSIMEGKPEISVSIDREKLANLGLQLEEIMTSLRIAMTGFEDLKFKQQNKEMPLRLQLHQKDRLQNEQLANISFINNKGQVIYLKQFASFKNIISETALERRNKNYSVTLFSKAIGKSVNEIGTQIQNFVEKNPPPQGIKISYEGDLELADDSFIYLGMAIMAGIIFVYLIMVALYNSFLYPFVVLFSIPVALIGALLALALTMKTLNVFSIFGMIMMLGLVAKNAILIVDRVNELKNNGKNIFFAVLEASKTRLRPILMTTLAMVIGMLPLALQKGSGGEYNSALAWVLIGGLTSSMLITIFIVPAIYLEFELVLNRIQKFKHKKKLAIMIFLFFCIANIKIVAQHTLTLKDIENKIKQDNQEVNIAQKEINKMDWVIKEAKGVYLPNIDINANYTRNIRPQVFFLPATFFDPTANANEFQSINASAKNVYQTNLNFNLSLLQFSNKYLVKQAHSQKTNAELNLKNVIITKITEAKRLYLDALWAKEQIDFWNESTKRQQALLEEMKMRVKQGFLNSTDTLQTYIQVQNLKPTIVRNENAYKNAIQSLKILLNIAQKEDIKLIDKLNDIDEQNLYLLQENNIENNKRPDLEQIKEQQKIILYQEKIEKSKLLPSLQLVGQYSILTQNENFKFNDYRWINTNLVGLQLNIPILNGFRNKAKIEQLKIQQRQIEQTYQIALKQAYTEIEILRSNLKEIDLQVQNQKDVIRVAERTYQLIYDRWKQGLAKINDLKEVELTLQEVKLNYLGLIYQKNIISNEIVKKQGL